jgi:hypothetical protein
VCGFALDFRQGWVEPELLRLRFDVTFQLREYPHILFAERKWRRVPMSSAAKRYRTEAVAAAEGWLKAHPFVRAARATDILEKVKRARSTLHKRQSE